MNTPNNIRHPKKKGGAPVLAVVITVVSVLVLAVIVGVWLFMEYYRPSVDTDSPFDTVDSPFGVETVDHVESKGPDGAEDTADDSETVEKVVRDTENVNFLIMGRDKDAWNTDVMMIVNFNYREGSMAVLQIPRDTYVEFGSSYGRLNTFMKIKRQAAYNADPTLSQTELTKAGVKGVADELEKSLCIQIDGYAIINLEGFRNVIDIIGGVYMDVPYDMHYEDPDQDLYIHIKKGPQTLNGAKSEQFVRFRSDYIQGDIGRVNAQKIFLTALFKQLQQSLTISTIPKLAEQAMRYVTTDLTVDEIVFYAKELMSVELGSISMMTLPGEGARSASGASYYVMNRADTLSAINGYFNVYNRDITDEMFDRDYAFTAENYPAFEKVYFAEGSGVAVDSADDIDNGEINIPRY